MHDSTYTIAHTSAFVIPVVELHLAGTTTKPVTPYCSEYVKNAFCENEFEQGWYYTQIYIIANLSSPYKKIHILPTWMSHTLFCCLEW